MKAIVTMFAVLAVSSAYAQQGETQQQQGHQAPAAHSMEQGHAQQGVTKQKKATTEDDAKKDEKDKDAQDQQGR